jgi:hypothetical protein
MKLPEPLYHHRLFFTFLVLFLLVGLVDLFNLDRWLYSGVCGVATPISQSPCATYYDLPIWNVYLSLAILAALYHVHDEIRTSNKHLSSRKH